MGVRWDRCVLCNARFVGFLDVLDVLGLIAEDSAHWLAGWVDTYSVIKVREMWVVLRGSNS